MKVNYKEVKALSEFIDAVRIRVNVFIIEQKFQPGWEPDEEDKISRHFIAVADDKIISTARFRETAKGEFKIERMVTIKEYRGKNIGTGLVDFMVEEIMKLKPKRIGLRSQVQSQPFYEKCGFKPISKPFEMWDVKHIDMELPSLNK